MRSHVSVILFDFLSSGVNGDCRESGRSMEIEILVHMFSVKAVHTSGMSLLDMHIAHMLPDNRSIFSFHQGIVIGSP